MDEIRVRDAVIEQITRERGNTLVTIVYGDCARCGKQRVTLIVNRSTRILDENGREIPAGDLEVGMTIDAAFSEVMTRSIPPQSQAFRIRVRERQKRVETTFGRILEVNVRNQFILTIRSGNPASIIRFNVTEDTRILDPLGRSISLSRLVPGLPVRVEHANFMTASIPPQTTAFVIQVDRW